MSKQITLMTVHAHPDDEVVFTGGTLLVYRERGVRTVLVTATGGEEGEIHDPDLDPEEAKPRLREIRREELRRGTEILGIDHVEMLDYRDSGMAGTEANANPDNFHMADLDEATAKLVALVRKYQPEILVTYDENGAYGHPDHIKCNLITHAAYEKAGDPTYHPELGEPWTPLKLYYTHWAQENWEKAREMFKERGLKWPWEEEERKEEEAKAQAAGEEPAKTEEEAIAEHADEVQEAKEEGKPPKYVPPPVTTRIDVKSVFPKKQAAIVVHRTQFAPDGIFTTMPEDIALVASGEEHYSLVASRVSTPEKEDDLLAGLD